MSNHHSKFLAIFRGVEQDDIGGKKSRSYPFIAMRQIAVRGLRHMDADTMRSFKAGVEVEGMELGPGNGLCCPYNPIKLRFTLTEEATMKERALKVVANT